MRSGGTRRKRPRRSTQESIDGLRAFLRDGDEAIDIGAHTGDSTIPMALAVGVHGLVFALEPNPYAFTVLAANATLNPDKARVMPLRFAATDADGQFDFEYSDAGYCNGGLHDGVARWKHGHFHRLRVDGRNLADYLRVHAPDSVSRIRYIKIDTEGHDRAVVRTLSGLIQVARPFIKTEIYQHLSDEERDAYQADLLALDYRLFRFGGDAGISRRTARTRRLPPLEALRRVRGSSGTGRDLRIAAVERPHEVLDNLLCRFEADRHPDKRVGNAGSAPARQRSGRRAT